MTHAPCWVCIAIEQGIILPPFVEIYITMALISLAGLLTGLFISSISSDSNHALSLLPVVLVPQIIFSGAVFPFEKQYLQIIGAFFPVRWALAAIARLAALAYRQTLAAQCLPISPERPSSAARAAPSIDTSIWSSA